MNSFIEVNGLVRIEVSDSIPEDAASTFLRTLSAELASYIDPGSIKDRAAVLAFRAGFSILMHDIFADSDEYHAVEDAFGGQ